MTTRTTFDWDGDDKLRAISVALNQGVQRGGIYLQGQIKLKLSKAGSGRIYRRGKTTHQASAPGEPPAVDTGQLRRSIQVDNSRAVGAGGEPMVRVGSNLVYARALELGIKGRLKQRPFIRPTLRDYKDRVIAIVRQPMERLIGR